MLITIGFFGTNPFYTFYIHTDPSAANVLTLILLTRPLGRPLDNLN